MRNGCRFSLGQLVSFLYYALAARLFFLHSSTCSPPRLQQLTDILDQISTSHRAGVSENSLSHRFFGTCRKLNAPSKRSVKRKLARRAEMTRNNRFTQTNLRTEWIARGAIPITAIRQNLINRFHQELQSRLVSRRVMAAAN